ncbi:MAG: hypothetical protein CXR30_15565 [Geobacter sp.]|nr:MAG: hypothetical protein CXR30_15565 [Geobacter sp.]
MYASAQSLDFLARRKNPRSPNRKPTVSHPEFPDGNYLDDTGLEVEMLNRNFVIQLLRTLHILSFSAWIGGGLGIAMLLKLDLQATTANDLQVFNQVIDAIDDWIITPGACLTLISGLALARFRRLCIMRTSWLRFKLFSTIIAIFFGYFFVARWLEKMQTYSTQDKFILFDDRLYSQVYINGAIGCAAQAIVVLTLLAVSIFRPHSLKH